jgi:hypothetical protein
MKRKITCIILVFFFANLSYSQNKKDSLKAYNEIKNWAVARLTIAYIEDFKGWDDKTSIVSINEKEKLKEWPSYKKIKNKYFKYTDKVNLDELSNQLSVGWIKTRDSVFKRYKLELIDSAVSNSFKNITFVPRIRKNDEKLKLIKKRKEAIQSINEQYEKSIIKYNAPNYNVNKSSSNNIQDRNLSRPRKPQEFSSLAMLLLGLSLVFNIFLILKLRKNKKNKFQNKISAERKNSSYWEKEYQKNKEDNRSLKRENDKFIQQINQLRGYTSQVNKSTKEDQIRKDEGQNTFTQNDIENKETQFVEEEKSITINLDIQKQKTTLIYLPAPFEERRFAVEDMSEIKKPESLYSVSVVEEGKKGNITLIETADLSRALNSPNIYLETVCEYENSYNPEAKGINVIEDGEVVLEGEDWVVKNKIKIKFI